MSAVRPAPYLVASGVAETSGEGELVRSHQFASPPWIGEFPIMATPWGTSVSTIESSGTCLIAVSEGNSALYRTYDLVNWEQLPSPQKYIRGLCYGDGVWIAGMHNGATLFRSTDDGETWSSMAGEVPATSNGAMLAYGNGMFLHMTSGACARSTDGGLSWEALPSPGFTPESFRFGGGVFCAVGGRTSVRYTTDGQSWTYARGISSASLCALAYGNEVWVAIETGNNGNNTFVSFDNWESSVSILSNRPSGGNPFTPTLAFCGGVFVQGQYGMHSAYDFSFDGIRWFPISGLPYYLGNDSALHRNYANLGDVGLVASTSGALMIVVQSAQKKVITE